MQMALYHPRWGYYSRRDALGESGDFYTSPELHPLFAAAVVTRTYSVWQGLGSPNPFDFVEVGGGSGRFARDFLLYVDECFPELSRALHYRIDDRGANLRKIQLERLIRAKLDRRVRWTDGSPSVWTKGSVRGMIVANELIDALSVHLVTARDGELQELYVREQGSTLALEPGPPSTPDLERYLRAIDVDVPDGVQWEINLNAPRWIQRTSRALERGALLLMDYGYPASDLYSASRSKGSLLCYAQHTVHSDPLRDPGANDITCHVDFTTLRLSLASANMTIVEDSSQAEALGGPSFSDWRDWTLAGESPWRHRIGLARSLDALCDPDGLGRLQWIMSVKGLQEVTPLVKPLVPAPRLTSLIQDHLLLPDPATLDPIVGIEKQWQELWQEDDEDPDFPR